MFVNLVYQNSNSSSTSCPFNKISFNLTCNAGTMPVQFQNFVFHDMNYIGSYYGIPSYFIPWIT